MLVLIRDLEAKQIALETKYQRELNELREWAYAARSPNPRELERMLTNGDSK